MNIELPWIYKWHPYTIQIRGLIDKKENKCNFVKMGNCVIKLNSLITGFTTVISRVVNQTGKSDGMETNYYTKYKLKKNFTNTTLW